jgi:hypothetical protein
LTCLFVSRTSFMQMLGGLRKVPHAISLAGFLDRLRYLPYLWHEWRSKSR